MPSLKLEPTEALYVLNTLVTKGRLSTKAVRGVLQDRTHEIRTIRQRIAELERWGSGNGVVRVATRRRRSAAAAAASAPAGHAKVKTVRTMSPKVRALRRQQGKYMGFVRNLNATAKAAVKDLKAKKGFPAAIRLAQKYAKAIHAKAA